ncbi:MAG: PspC domain-containing protein [Balneolaceae bacterium]
MSERIKNKSFSKTGSATLEFDEFELESTMQDFLKEETKEEGKGLINIATIAGLGMLFVALTFMLQSIGLPIGEGLASFSRDAIEALPIIGGVLVTLIGFGYLVGDRRKERKAKRHENKRRKQATKDFVNDIHGAEATGSRLNNDLDGEETDSSSFSYSNKYSSSSTYGYKQAKQLVRSRTDKKLSGVCGGLARYFGISSTVIRLIFVVSFFMYGTSFLIYLGLAIAMPKEPVELMDDFDF